MVPWSSLQWVLWFRQLSILPREALCSATCRLRFDPETMALICLPEGSEETIRLPIQGITKAQLMGELAVLQAMPIYQLALPFSLAAWRQLEYAQNLTGMTL
jgi:hypothetical protein